LNLSPYVQALCIALLAGVVLLAMGRVPICTCGTIKLWHGAVNSSENSQHLSDWYTFSHVIHGFIFYAILWWLAPGWSVAQRLVAAVAMESSWEVLENTPIVIERYRAATIALSYYGDSVINSLSDIAAMVAGFALASRLPVWMTIALAAGMEAGTAYVIRDNLTLNVLMLIHPVEAIKVWQAAAGGS
jgi:hypothetical protein